MNYGVYNAATNHLLTVVSEPCGELPPGYAFVPEADVPANATRGALEAVVVPEEVPTWALREVCAATVRAGQAVTLHAEIEAAIAALPEPHRAIALNRWEYKPTIRRQDAVTLALTALLGLTEGAADDLFVAAQART